MSFACLSSVSAVSFSTKTNSDGTVTISRCSNAVGDVVIPDTIDGKKVTAIGESVFSSNYDITSITIPDSVTEIGYNAFASCSNLESVIIADSVTSINNYAFNYCKKLTDVICNEKQKDFFSSSIYIDTMPPDGQSIDTEDIMIGDYEIDEYLIHIGISGSIWIKKYYGNNTVITIPADIEGFPVRHIGSNAFYNDNGVKEIVIPESVTSIGYGAFANCGSLVELTIPDSVISIGEEAFYNCDGLTAVTIPDSVTSIGSYAFCNRKQLQEVTVKGDFQSSTYFSTGTYSEITFKQPKTKSLREQMKERKNP